MQFEWDEDKNQENIEKHGISFEEDQDAFEDERKIIRPDDKHSNQEKRFFCYGRINGKIVTVRFTMREETIRIFGAGYWRYGKDLYEEENA